MDSRQNEMELLANATGSASKLVRTDRAVLRKMRHADEEVGVAKRPDSNGGAAKNGGVAKNGGAGKNGGAAKKNGGAAKSVVGVR